MKKFIIANWKMNPQTAKEAEEIVLGIQEKALEMKNLEIVVCPPFVYLDRLSKYKTKLGAQDFFWENPAQGSSFTGEISLKMLKNFGVKYVIAGHSERREYFGETNETINKKIKVGLKAGLKVIFCVGEEERDDKGEYLKFIKKEILEGLKGVSRKELSNLIICYEPIWAISSHKSAIADTPENFLEASIYIRRSLFFRFGHRVAYDTPIMYGGSVDAKNAKDFLEKGKAAGLLVGRASWKTKTFLDLLKSIR